MPSSTKPCLGLPQTTGYDAISSNDLNMSGSKESSQYGSMYDSASPPEKQTVVQAIRDFVLDLWLFTESDFSTFVLPNTSFGIFGALAGSLLLETPVQPLDVLPRVPLVVFSHWANLLIFDLANQRTPEAAKEDSINKPRRPVASGRVSPRGARVLLLAAIPTVLFIQYLIGPWEEAALLFILAWMYNDLRGGDEDFVTRNLILAPTFAFCNSASLKVAAGSRGAASISPQGYTWIAIISAVIFTTMHSQDMKDQEGDRTRERKTVPLVLGDLVARHTLAVPIAAWSVACPWFWGSGVEGYALVLPLGLWVIWRLYTDRTIEGDRRSWKLWTLWTALLYLLPLVQHFASLGWGLHHIRM